MTGTNDAPVAEAATGAVAEDASITGTISASDVDLADDASLVFSTESTVEGLTLNADGSYSFDASSYDSLEAGETQVITIPVTVTDDQNATDTTTLTITVTGTNDAPVAEAATGAVAEDASITGTISASDVDLADDASLVFSTESTVEGLTLNADGSYSFDASSYDSLEAGETQVITIPVTVTDDQNATDTTTLTITVTGTNDAPVAEAATGAVAEDASITGTISASDVDLADDASLVFSTESTVEGLTLNADGSYSFDASSYDSLEAGETQVITIPVTVTDDQNATDTTTLTITVTGTNDAPVAEAATGAVAEDASITGTISASDVDLADDASLVFSTESTVEGLTLNADGSYSFDASSYDSLEAGETQVITIPVTVTDDQNATDTTTLTITVTGTNDAPVAEAATGAVAEDASITGTISASDVDLADDASLVFSTESTVEGLTLNADGSYSFDASSYDSLEAGETQVITIPVTVTDDQNATDTTTLTITVTGTNDAPVAEAATGAVAEDASITGTISASDVDLADDASLVFSTESTVEGLTLNADGSYSFDASSYDSLEAGETQVITIPVTVTDDQNATDTTTLTITVTGTNDAPVAEAATGAVAEDASITGTISASDVDLADDASLVFSTESTVEGLTLNADGSYSFDASSYDSLEAGETQVITIPVTVTDDQNATDTTTLTITVTGTNDAPVAEAATGAVAEDASITGTISASDVDLADDASLVFSTESTVEGLTLNADGSYSFDASSYDSLEAGETQVITIPVTVTDDQNATDTTTLTITVTGTNDAPVAEAATGAVAEDASITGTISASDVDLADDASLVFSTESTVEGLTLNADGSYSFDASSYDSLEAGETQVITIPVTVTDDQNATDTTTLTITVTGTNDAPVAVADVGSVTLGSAITLDVLSNDTDVEGDSLTITAASVSAEQGVVEIVDNELVFTPADGFTGTASITYTVSDGNGGFDTAEVSVGVNSVTVDAITSDDVINATESGETIAVTGSATGGDIAAGDTVTLVINEITYTTTVGADGSWSVDVSGSDLAADTAFNAVVESSDAAGNTVESTGSSTHTVDTSAEGRIDVDWITSDSIINSDESATGALVAITGHVGNDAQPGDLITITLEGNVIGEGTVSAEQDDNGNYLYSVDVLGSTLANTSLANPSIEVTVSGTDDAGNSFSASSTEVYQVDLFADVEVFVEDNNYADSDNVVNFDEQGNILISGFFEAGGSVNSITITDSQGNEVIISSDEVMIDQDYFEVTSDVTALLDGTLSVVVNVTDAAGNTEDSFTETIVKDTVADAGTVLINQITSDDVVNASEAAGTVSVTGTAAGGDIGAGDTVTMTINGEDYTTTVDGNGNWTVDVAGSDLVAVTEFNVIVSSSDAAGNTVNSIGTSSHTIDTSADADNNFSVTVAATDEETDESEVSDVSVSLAGVDEDAVSVQVTFTDSDDPANTVTVTATQNGSSWIVADTDLSGLSDGNISVTATVTDSAGNTSIATDTLELDTSNSAPVIGSIADAALSEEGLTNANPEFGDSTVTSVTTNFNVSDEDTSDLAVTLTAPTDSLTSNGVVIVWSGTGTDTLIGSANGVEVIRVTATDPVDGVASYTSTLSGPVDHADGTTEDELSFDLDVVVSDGENDISETVSISIQDDSPEATTSTASLTLSAASTITVKNLEAGFSDTSYAPDENEVTETDNDSDALIDEIAWGTGSDGASSLALTDDTGLTSGTGSEVESGISFDLLDFEHVNTAVSSNTSSLESADLDITFDLEINGTTTAVTIALAVTHSATVNTGSDTDDTVTIQTQSVDVEVDGQTYTIVIEGFTDSNNNTVTTISTAEGATGNYSLTAHIDAPTSNAQSVSGTLELDVGADGGSVVAASSTDDNGTLVVNSDGSYTFTASDSLVASVEANGAQTISYSYSVVDADGDTVVNTLSIDIENDVETHADTYTSSEDVVISVDAENGVLANDITDLDISVSSYSVSGQVADAGNAITIAGVGEIVINSDGSYGFTPVEDWSGDVPQVTYTTNTGDSSTLDIDVTAVADIPTLAVTLGEAGSEESTETSSNVSNLGLNTSSEDTETRTLDFGVENAGQTVILSFDSIISGEWESSGSYADSYEIYANDVLLESFTYSLNYNESESQSNSYSVVLDSNGQVEVDFIVDSTGSDEEVDISNIQATLDSNSSIRELTISAAQTDNDGSETLTYSIAALPAGVSLLDSNGNTINPDQDGNYALTQAQLTGLQLDTGDVTESFDVSVTVTSSEGGTSEAVTQTVSVEGSTATVLGLSAQYYAYDDSTNGNLSDIDDAMAVVNENDPTATFTATELSYSYGTGDLGRDTNLEDFLGDDAASLSANPSTETGDAVIYMTGDVSLDAGSYSIKVYADDGYQIIVDGVVVASADYIQSPTTKIETFDIATSGEHTIEIVYWDQGGAYVFDVQLSDDGGANYNVLGSDAYPTSYTSDNAGESASSGYVQDITSLDDRIAAFTQDDASYGQNGSDQYVHKDWKANNIVGDSNNNIIDSGSNDDTVYGQGGDDYIEGQSGADYIDGGSGNDYLDGGSQDDTIYGGDDNDHLIGQSGDDYLSGEDGDDWLEGGSNDDDLYGGDGSDLLEGDTGDDYLSGGDGDDLLYAGENSDTLLGDAGDDILMGEGGSDSLSGGADDDILVGGTGSDTLTGGTGADMFVLEDTNDTITDFDAAEDSLDITELLSDMDDAPADDASTDAIAEFLSSHVSATDGAVKVDGSDVASFGSDSDFDSDNSGSVNSSDTVSIIYNDQEYTINIDG
ncbi:VCBS domain-containing protein [Marinomonas sp. MED121]|uniref:VCBS domain-containing protein n=1 Tax=Marinomonas sp. MED121 TaxID=314277 RepID=UPI0002E40DEA|nr:VCBS domain-containing protein [Marinomonas sp. MED121]